MEPGTFVVELRVSVVDDTGTTDRDDVLLVVDVDIDVELASLVVDLVKLVGDVAVVEVVELVDVDGLRVVVELVSTVVDGATVLPYTATSAMQSLATFEYKL